VVAPDWEPLTKSIAVLLHSGEATEGLPYMLPFDLAIALPGAVWTFATADFVL